MYTVLVFHFADRHGVVRTECSKRINTDTSDQEVSPKNKRMVPKKLNKETR